MPDDCSKIAQSLSAYLDGELDSRNRASVEAHLKNCAACAGELSLLAAVDADVKRLPAVEPPPFFAARVAAAARSANRYSAPRLRFLRLPVPAMVVMVSFILVNLFTFAFNINAMENGPRRELARKVAAQLARPASLINPLALARLCGECDKYMCLCMHEAGKKSLCPCKGCEMEKMQKQAEAGNPAPVESMEEHHVR